MGLVSCFQGGYCGPEYTDDGDGHYCVTLEEWDVWLASECPDCSPRSVDDGSDDNPGFLRAGCDTGGK